MPIRLRICLVIFALVLSHAVHAQGEALFPYAARKIAPGVHVLTTPPDYLGAIIGNITLIEQSDGVVMIDSGQTAGDGRRAAAFVRSLGAKPVKALVYTHWHGDHPQGGSAIQAAWPGVRIIATRRTAEMLRSQTLRYVGLQPDPRFEAINRQQIEALIAGIDAALKSPDHDPPTRARYDRMRREANARIADFRGTALALPTETFTERLVLDDPERPVEVRFPGRANTDGDAIAWLPKQRIVVTGDVVVSPIPFGFFSFPGDWLETIAGLKALGFTTLVPGHGEPQADSAYLDKVAAAIRDIRDQVGPLARRGLPLATVEKRVDHSRQMAIFGDTPRNKRLFEAFWLKPMTVNAYREARGFPIAQGDDAIYQ